MRENDDIAVLRRVYDRLKPFDIKKELERKLKASAFDNLANYALYAWVDIPRLSPDQNNDETDCSGHSNDVPSSCYSGETPSIKNQMRRIQTSLRTRVGDECMRIAILHPPSTLCPYGSLNIYYLRRRLPLTASESYQRAKIGLFVSESNDSIGK